VYPGRIGNAEIEAGRRAKAGHGLDCPVVGSQLRPLGRRNEACIETLKMSMNAYRASSILTLRVHPGARGRVARRHPQVKPAWGGLVGDPPTHIPGRGQRESFFQGEGAGLGKVIPDSAGSREFLLHTPPRAPPATTGRRAVSPHRNGAGGRHSGERALTTRLLSAG
jgi:hypothetical protein